MYQSRDHYFRRRFKLFRGDFVTVETKALVYEHNVSFTFFFFASGLVSKFSVNRYSATLERLSNINALGETPPAWKSTSCQIKHIPFVW